MKNRCSTLFLLYHRPAPTIQPGTLLALLSSYSPSFQPPLLLSCSDRSNNVAGAAFSGSIQLFLNPSLPLYSFALKARSSTQSLSMVRRSETPFRKRSSPLFGLAATIIVSLLTKVDGALYEPAGNQVLLGAWVDTAGRKPFHFISAIL